MFENFSFSVETHQHDHSIEDALLSPLTMNDCKKSPFFPSPFLTSQTPSSCSGYFSPPYSPAESIFSSHPRNSSISSTLEHLSIKEPRAMTKNSNLLEPFIHERSLSPQQDCIRSQRQMLSRLHAEEAQKKSLADLVEDMITKGQSCSVTISPRTLLYPSPPSSLCGEEIEDEIAYDKAASVSGSLQKSWTYGALPTNANSVVLSKSGIQKRVKIRKSLVGLNGERIVPRRSRR